MALWIRRTIVVFLLLITSNGCLVLRKRERVIRESEPRRVTHFQSARAQQQFQGHALNAKARRQTGSRRFLAIPFLVVNSESSVLSENAYYNDEAVRCDTNGDGLLSDLEVAEYSYIKAKDLHESDNAPPAEVVSERRLDVKISYRPRRPKASATTAETPADATVAQRN